MNSVQYKLFLTHPSLFPLNGNGGANIDICRSGKKFYDTLNNMQMGSTTNLVFSKSNLD